MNNIINNFINKINKKKTHKDRIAELRKKGLKMGKNVVIHPQASIDSNFCFLISIGDNSIIARGARLLAHDSSAGFNNGGYGKLGRIEIKENCIISNYAILLPGVTIGPNVLVAAHSVVNKDIPPNSCVAGTPARFYSSFDDYINKEKELIKESYIVDAKQILLNKNGIDEELRNKIIEETEKGFVYMENIVEVAKIRKKMFFR